MITERLLALKIDETFQSLCEDIDLTTTEIERVLHSAAQLSQGKKITPPSYGSLTRTDLSMLPDKLQQDLIKQLKTTIDKSKTSDFANRVAQQGQPAVDRSKETLKNLVHTLEQRAGRKSELVSNVRKLIQIGSTDLRTYIATYALVLLIERATQKYTTLTIASFLAQEAVRLIQQPVKESIVEAEETFDPAELLTKYINQTGGEADKKKLVAFLKAEGLNQREAEYLANEFLNYKLGSAEQSEADKIIKQWQAYAKKNNDDSAQAFYRFLVDSGFPENLVSLSINQEFTNAISDTQRVQQTSAGKLPPNRAKLLNRIENIVAYFDLRSKSELFRRLQHELRRTKDISDETE